MLIRFVCISNATDIFEKVSFSTNCEKEKKNEWTLIIADDAKKGFQNKIQRIRWGYGNNFVKKMKNINYPFNG